MKEIIALLEQAAAKLEAMDPQPESAPGPLMSDSGRAYQMLSSVREALNWKPAEYK